MTKLNQIIIEGTVSSLTEKGFNLNGSFPVVFSVKTQYEKTRDGAEIRVVGSLHKNEDSLYIKAEFVDCRGVYDFDK